MEPEVAWRHHILVSQPRRRNFERLGAVHHIDVVRHQIYQVNQCLQGDSSVGLYSLLAPCRRYIERNNHEFRGALEKLGNMERKCTVKTRAFGNFPHQVHALPIVNFGQPLIHLIHLSTVNISVYASYATIEKCWKAAQLIIKPLRCRTWSRRIWFDPGRNDYSVGVILFFTLGSRLWRQQFDPDTKALAQTDSQVHCSLRQSFHLRHTCLSASVFWISYLCMWTLKHYHRHILFDVLPACPCPCPCLDTALYLPMRM